jgi:hypothetical protein
MVMCDRFVTREAMTLEVGRPIGLNRRKDIEEFLVDCQIPPGKEIEYELNDSNGVWYEV